MLTDVRSRQNLSDHDKQHTWSTTHQNRRSSHRNHDCAEAPGVSCHGGGASFAVSAELPGQRECDGSTPA
jgi:hypothetical protein